MGLGVHLSLISIAPASWEAADADILQLSRQLSTIGDDRQTIANTSIARARPDDASKLIMLNNNDERGSDNTYRQPSLVKPYPRPLIWLPIVIHSEPLMTPMFLTDKMVKNRSRSALSDQFLLFMAQDIIARR